MKIFIFLHFPHFFFIVVCNSLCMPWWAKNTFRFQKKNYSVFNLRNSLERESSGSSRRRRIILANVIVFYTFFALLSPLFIMIYFAITQMLSTFASAIAVVIMLHTHTHIEHYESLKLRSARCKNRDWARKWM